MLFLVLTNVLFLCKMITLGKTMSRVYGNSLYCLCSVSVNPKLSPNKTFIKHTHIYTPHNQELITILKRVRKTNYSNSTLFFMDTQNSILLVSWYLNLGLVF